MKTWHRYVIGLVLGLATGGGLAWRATGSAFDHGNIRNGVWSTSLGYGTAAADPLTRAAVARRGLLALPKSEAVYWSASADSKGAPLDGSCTYKLTGGVIDSRWWSITLYDRKGFLIANADRIWSFSGASVDPAHSEGWQVTISPRRPAGGHWIPSAKGKAFELTLRLYNAGADVLNDPGSARLPTLTKETCA